MTRDEIGVAFFSWLLIVSSATMVAFVITRAFRGEQRARAASIPPIVSPIVSPVNSSIISSIHFSVIPSVIPSAVIGSGSRPGSIESDIVSSRTVLPVNDFLVEFRPIIPAHIALGPPGEVDVVAAFTLPVAFLELEIILHMIIVIIMTSHLRVPFPRIPRIIGIRSPPYGRVRARLAPRLVWLGRLAEVALIPPGEVLVPALGIWTLPVAVLEDVLLPSVVVPESASALA